MAVEKKHWVPVLAPTQFKEEQLGESYVLETDTLTGRAITTNLMTVTGDMKKQHLNVSFQITKVQDGKARTRTTGLEMHAGSTKRLVRRGRTKIAESLAITLKHGQQARIKPLIVTKFIVSNSVGAGLRHKVREEVTAVCKDLSFETLISDITSGKLQRHLRNVVQTVCPIRSVDIRKCDLLPVHAMDEEHEVEESTYSAAETATDDDTDRS